MTTAIPRRWPIIKLQPLFKVKPLMRIGELAQAAGCNTSRIRFYEQQGLIAPAVRQGNNYREYPASALKTLKLIMQAQSFGFSLAQISEGLHADIGSGRRCDHVLAMLRTKLAETDASLQAITLLRAKVAGQIAVIEQIN